MNKEGDKMFDFNIKPFHFWCQKVLPLVYDDALSYYETLCKVVAKLNEVIEAYNNIELDLDNYIEQKINAIVDSAINELNTEIQKQITNLQTNIDNNYAYIQSQIEGLNTKADNYYNELNTKLNLNAIELHNAIEALTTEIESKIAYIIEQNGKFQHDTQSYIGARLKTFEEMIKLEYNFTLIDPTTGRQLPLQTILNNLWSHYRWRALTAWQYDSIQLTAKQYDDMLISAYDYDFFGLVILGAVMVPWRVHSGWTGNYTSIQQDLRELWQFVRSNGITAINYDNEQLTALTYDSMLLTARDYDFSGLTNTFII